MGRMIRYFQRSPRAVIALVSALILFLGVVGGTLAVIRAYSAPVENTFSVNGISIDLYETETDDGDGDPYTNSYRMMPGQVITKDPAVSVDGGSMACWLFVRLQESENFDDFLSYDIQEGWQALAGVDGVYYRRVEAQDWSQVFGILKDNQVKVLEHITVDMLRVLNPQSFPTLTVSAYAVQLEGIADVESAWQLAKEL